MRSENSHSDNAAGATEPGELVCEMNTPERNNGSVHASMTASFDVADGTLRRTKTRPSSKIEKLLALIILFSAFCSRDSARRSQTLYRAIRFEQYELLRKNTLVYKICLS